MAKMNKSHAESAPLDSGSLKGKRDNLRPGTSRRESSQQPIGPPDRNS